MLESELLVALENHLEKLVHDVIFLFRSDESDASINMGEFLSEVCELSPRLALEESDDSGYRPSFCIQRKDADVSVDFAAIPMGHEFTSFVLALLQVGGHPPVIDPEIGAEISNVAGDHVFETVVSLSCQKCPDVVQALNIMSVLNPNIRHTTIDGGLFPEEVEERQIGSVPAIFHNGELFEYGLMSLEEILGKLSDDSASAAVQRISDRDPYDVIVVGAGPAGCASAMYAARKGLRTAVVSDRFGGQLLDTLGIENLPSVIRTEGPVLARDLEQQLRNLELDIISSQNVEKLIPANESGLHLLRLASGAEIKGRSVVVATGARWRRLEVPGEEEYLNKGVAFCPHCDGPLFKGKRVAVVGGGNSGVEAAIDLAGLASHVTLIEFMPELLADDVLQRTLERLENVQVVLSAATKAIDGNGEGVTGLVYEDRVTGEDSTVELDGVFVQIGLIPNTEWLSGTLELSERNEVIVDARCRTSIAGVVAAGDCTTEPYKQIVVAMGAGSTAGLSAFDHLIRNSVNMTEVQI
ncbi:MAG TPA: alkyl hydroperoxide reductase subunit F [Acidimicrobiaceae bacterium]|nr:alkyl hydroperoxide reductase subunit F [Acidimicrobiaceae bacterium]